MDKLVPSLPTNPLLTEDKYRNKLTAKNKELPQKKQKLPARKENFTESELLELVNEINAYFTSYGQHLLVLINKNDDKTTLNIINSKTQEEVKQISAGELDEVARNLRNHKLTLIQRDV